MTKAMIATKNKTLFQMWEEIGNLRTTMATEHDRLLKKYKVPMEHPKMKSIMSAYKTASDEFVKRLMSNDSLMAEKNETIAQLREEKEKTIVSAKDELAKQTAAISALQFENAILRGQIKMPPKSLFDITNNNIADNNIAGNNSIDSMIVEHASGKLQGGQNQLAQNHSTQSELTQMKFAIGKMHDEMINQSFIIDELRSRLKESVMALMEYQAIYTAQPIMDENMA